MEFNNLPNDAQASFLICESFLSAFDNVLPANAMDFSLPSLQMCEMTGPIPTGEASQAKLWVGP